MDTTPSTSSTFSPTHPARNGAAVAAPSHRHRQLRHRKGKSGRLLFPPLHPSSTTPTVHPRPPPLSPPSAARHRRPSRRPNAPPLPVPSPPQSQARPPLGCRPSLPEHQLHHQPEIAAVFAVSICVAPPPRSTPDCAVSSLGSATPSRTPATASSPPGTTEIALSAPRSSQSPSAASRRGTPPDHRCLPEEPATGFPVAVSPSPPLVSIPPLLPAPSPAVVADGRAAARHRSVGPALSRARALGALPRGRPISSG
uniref:Far-red impaired response-like n=1 Tax=Oryza sativa subsp. japonica TaxID=39947 RepID=Q6H717_ORYSJ|nr:far-red impaired response-like [Oryza sativa Japonica Group]BAD25482.1 far-red impaired response-like [Oryza sativa Japonica Group]